MLLRRLMLHVAAAAFPVAFVYAVDVAALLLMMI
jgi:hypothetical protein